ncbi:MAG: protein kinase [Anaerolineales bacterium]|nr:protein kinase [Anaerolineales bacterium]
MTLDIKLGKYTLLEEIGRGGYGTVYRARDETLQVERAVKVLHPELVVDPSFIERFREEARLVARLKHPHILPVYDLGEDQGRFYLAMEYMSGGSLKDLLANEVALPFERSLDVLKQVSDALDYAHGQNLVHRDVKPGNILFDTSGNAYLTDFGFAKSLASADSSTTMSLTGGILGTPAYMSPEAWDGKGWTPAADVYSLACVFFEMLMGKVLYDGETPTLLMKQHVIEGPQLPKEWPAEIPERIDAVFKNALAARPGERCTSARLFARGIENVVQPQDEPHIPWWQQWGVWAGFAGVVTLILTMILLNIPIPPPTHTPTLTSAPSSSPIKTLTFTPTLETTQTATPADISPTQALITSERGLLIKDRGTILIGVRYDDNYPMFFQDGKSYNGFEVDLAREIVRRLFGDQVMVWWMPLEWEQSLGAAENDQVDFLIRNTTHTISREEQVSFTSNYFLDGVRLLVRRSDGYSSIEDLDGKTIVALNESYAAPVKNSASRLSEKSRTPVFLPEKRLFWGKNALKNSQNPRFWT